MERIATLSPSAEALMAQVNEDLVWAAEHEAELLRQSERELDVVHQREVTAPGDDEADLIRIAASAAHPCDKLVVVEMLSPGPEISPGCSDVTRAERWRESVTDHCN